MIVLKMFGQMAKSVNDKNSVAGAKQSSGKAETSGPSRQDIFRMFDRIASRYDFLNRFLSFGRDVYWRRRMVQFLPSKSNLDVLDLATGTADVLLTLCRKSDCIANGVGVDMAGRMLQGALVKVVSCRMQKKLAFVRADASRLPFASASFDVVTIAFGIRNFISVQETLQEIHRVLATDGRLLILEFSLPSNRLIRCCYLFYFRHVLPLLGSLISGDLHAYRYLNRTVETFPYGENFCNVMRQAGFTKVRTWPYTFGVAAIYQGDKS
ncbi:MAG: bifunctional demethylmenaquinone methyltransferase/2-methoxy-6-polyprenyl-1,4-benzoquinol methylase UbiE [candidate division Zixibacteria bacterium]|nr:bifunctional demethylmenaquinone methyltransferase/2-methoxy-6-polyprenyl-1,4-benzoquinol methylase UbiE [candidate division Zixibacteria bacterium]